MASLGRSALASVPELHVSSFRHAAWLNFAGFSSSGDFFAYRILLSTIVCDIAVLLVPGAPNENVVQNHLNIALLNVF